MAETIAEIKALVRDVTQQQSESQINDDLLLEYINSFYQNQFFLDIGKSVITKMWNFQTLPNQDEYEVAESYRLITSKQVQVAQDDIDLYIDELEFDRYFNDAYHNNEALDTGDGATATFSGTLDNSPVVPKSMIVSDGVETFKDVEGSGVLTGSLGGIGTVTYLTGAYSITFNTAPTDGDSIYSTYAEYTAAQPSAVLYFDNILKFRPIPDKTYNVNVQVAQRFASLTDSSTLTNLLWGDAIAYGTAVDMLDRLGNPEDANNANALYKKKLSLIKNHQYKTKSSTTRAKPRW